MHTFRINWNGEGWYGQRSGNGVTTLYYLDDDPSSDYTYDRQGTIGEVSRREGYGSPVWFDHEPTQVEMAAGHNIAA